MTTSRTTIRTFWASVLAKARTDELVEMIETLASRRPSEGSEADSDLLVLARRALQHRRAMERDGERAADRA
jgi:hypothetical protein